MNEIQPLVSIQVGGATSGQTSGALEISLGDPQAIGLWSPGNVSSSENISTLGGSFTQNPSRPEMKNIAAEFVRILDQMLTAFRGFLEKLLERIPAPAPGATGGTTPNTGTTTSTGTGSSASTTGSGTAPTSTSAGSSTSSGATGSSGTTGSSGSTGGTIASPSQSSTTGSTPSTPTGTSTGSTSGTSTTPTTTTSAPTTPAPAATNCSCPPASTPATGTTPAKLPKTGQLLWKPKADKDGKLVVLLPKRYGRAKSVRVLSPDGKTVLASGRFSGIANGDRAHYRFGKAGDEFPRGSILQLTTSDNKVFQLPVPETSQRFVY